jgi:hypothetical protein
MAELISHHTGQTIETITADSDRDRWFTADEAKDYGFVDPLQAMPPTYYHRDSVIAYRRYYNGAKQHILKYTKRHPPHWLQITQTATT